MDQPSFAASVPLSYYRSSGAKCARFTGSRRLKNPYGLRRGASISCALTDDELQDKMEELEGTKLKWAEIDFPTIQDELRAIDEYVVAEDIAEDDCWPMFLRAGAYESRGQSRLAFAQLAKIVHKAGITRVPNLWERRAYNAFKIGDVAGANAYTDVALRLYYEAQGNELHFAHWFEENFKGYLPRHNGPAYPFQRGMFKYCVGLLQEAREQLVGGIITNALGAEHAVLWLLASGARQSVDGTVAKVDWDVIIDWRSSYDRPVGSTLRVCIDLYSDRAAGTDSTAEELVQELKSIANGPQGGASLTAMAYLALYYDAISRNEEERDVWLDKISALPGGPSNTGVLDFVYHACKCRFSSNNINAD